MNNNILLQSFAVDKDGRIRGVDEVSRGLACDCFCPSCGEKVIARKGEIREWHFAHTSEVECDGAAESALHLAAKQVLLDSSGITLPEVVENVTVELPDGRTGTAQSVRSVVWLDYESVELEKSYGEVKPDAVVSFGDEILFIEIAVTHFVDDEKAKIIEDMDIPTIEIDLSGIGHYKWDWDSLKEAVIDGAILKRWIHQLGKDELVNEARQSAFSIAMACPTPVISNKPKRTRFWVGKRMIDVIERPFGLAVWSPYDPVLNETVKSLMRIAGGRWQPRFKNWLLPTEAKEWIFGELSKLSSKPPELMN